MTFRGLFCVLGIWVISFNPTLALAQGGQTVSEPVVVWANDQERVIPGRVEYTEWLSPYTLPQKPKPIDPVPQWSSQKPVYQSAIAQGAVVSLTLTSPMELSQLRPGDVVEFETTAPLMSTDGRWSIPSGSIAHAKVATKEWSQTGFKKMKLGLLFYEFVTPKGWVIPFEGYLLGMPKPKRSAPSLAVSIAQGQMPAGGPGVLMFTLNPLAFRGAKQRQLSTSEVFPLRIGQAIYYGAALAYQDKVREDKDRPAPDTGVIPVNYSHFSDSATQDIEQYQDDKVLQLP